jgi:hypothetical protein
MSLRCRYAPAYGSEVVSFRPVYPALIPQCGFSSKSIAPRERDGARTVSRLRRFVHVSAPRLSPALKASIGRASVALCMSPHLRLILALKPSLCRASGAFCMSPHPRLNWRRKPRLCGAFGALCMSPHPRLSPALRYAIKHKILRPYPDAEENASGYTGLRMTFFARDMCFSFLNACFLNACFLNACFLNLVS